MKKLIIALGVVAVAAGVQASSFQWRISNSSCMYDYNGNSTSEKYYTGTGYLFNEAAVTQQSVLDAFLAGTDISTLGSLQSNDIDDGEASLSTKFNWGNTGDELKAYYAAVVEDGGNSYLFISETLAQTGTESTTQYFKFDPEDASAQSPFAAKTTFAQGGSGWYQAESVPEPTSGLLLLLGVAGLALRRRRA